MSVKELGKIRDVIFGLHEDCLVVHLIFSGAAWGSVSIDIFVHNPDFYKKIHDILTKAKVYNLNQLKNIPVEVTFDSNTLKDWRILEEVL